MFGDASWSVIVLPNQLLTVLLHRCMISVQIIIKWEGTVAEEEHTFSEDDVKRDIKTSLEHGFPNLSPLSINFDEIAKQENGTFKVSFVVTMNEGQRAGFSGGVVGYKNDGQFVILKLPRIF